MIGARRRIGHVLVDLGLATERQIAVAVAEQLNLRVVDLTTVAISAETVRLLPRSVALRLGMVVLSRTGNQLTLAVIDPTDVVALDDVRLHTGATELVVMVATESQVREHLTRVWSLSEDSSDLSTFFEESDARAPRRRPARGGRRRTDRAPGELSCSPTPSAPAPATSTSSRSATGCGSATASTACSATS